MIGRRRSTATIPVAGAAGLLAASRRLALARLALAAALVLVLALAVALASRVREPEAPLLKPGRTLVALDISTSIDLADYRNVAAALRAIADTRQTAGLVLFSSDAYVALPPGTPAAELRSFARYFARRGADSIYTPWLQLSGGTRITHGLQEARAALLQGRLAGSTVLLISDLVDTPSDLPRLRESIEAYRRDGITLRILPLGNEGRRLFERLVGREALVRPADLAPERAAVTAGAPDPEFAVPVALLGALLVVLLAVNEHWGAPLVWHHRRPKGAS